MKKSLAFFLSFIILIVQFTVFAYSNDTPLSFEDFSLLVAKMTQKYDSKKHKMESDENENIVLANRLIIKTSDNTPLFDDYGAIDKIEGYDCLHILQYESEEATQNSYNFYANQPSIEYVEYDFTFTIDSIPEATDSLSAREKNKEWGSNKINSFPILKSIRSSNREWEDVVVAVIDSGIDLDNPLFAGRIVDSTHNYVFENNNPNDIYGHGTSVSGIIVKNTTSNVKIKPYKTITILGKGSYLNTCNAIFQAIQDGVEVINISSGWSHKERIYNRFYESIRTAVLGNIPVIVSAGNKHIDASGWCPAGNSDAITVSSIRIDNSPLDDSNFGETVDIAAPGSNIYTAKIYAPSKEGYFSGTSAAAPFVSAAAAVLKTVIPGITPQQIKDRLKNTAYVPPGWDTNYGAGIVDFKAMLADKMTSPPTINIGGNSATITAEPDSTIYYTTNGTDPTVESTVYTGAFSTSNIKEIRAIAFKSGLLPSETAVHTFKWIIDVDVTVNKTAKIDFPEGMSPLYIENRNPEIAVLSTDGTVEGVEIGDAVCVAYFGNNHSAVYHIHVDYNWFVRLIRKLFAWLFWIIDLFRLS